MAKNFPRHAPTRPANEPGTSPSGAPPHAALETELRAWDKTRPDYHPEHHLRIHPDFRHGRQDLTTADPSYDATTNRKAGNH